MNLLSKLNGLTRLGVNPDAEDELSMRIIFSNVIFFTLPVVYLVFLIIDFDSYLEAFHQLEFDQFVVPLMIFVCFVCLWLNSNGHSKLSRLAFIISWPLLLHIVPIVLQHTPIDYYFAYPMGLIVHALFVQLMFSRRLEPIPFWGFLLMSIVGILSSSIMLTSFDTANKLRELTDSKYYVYDGILYWLLFNLMTFYILHTVEGYIQRINASKLQVEEHQEELRAINQNLEDLVNQRTALLEEQNQKLTNYAFYNAHVLRGPFSRVKGLIQLTELSTAEADKDVIKEKLAQSLQELDEKIREIQEIVSSEKGQSQTRSVSTADR